MGNKTWMVTKYSNSIWALIIFTISLTIYLVTSPGNTAFNHFVLLADAFNHGNIYIEGEMPWLEKIPIDNNRFYVANPPMPAIIATLPVLVFGKNLPQQYLSYIFGAVVVTLTFLISLKIKKDLKLALWSSLLIGFGTINWYLISVGSTWYLAQVIAQLFLLCAIYSQLKNKNPIIVGLFLGFAYFSRIPAILTFPFFVINLPRPRIKSLVLFSLGVLPSILANFAYNYIRFGVIWDIGYTMIPGVSSEAWYQKGLVHPSYIVEHLKIIFLTIPSFDDIIKFRPSLFGYAIWFTSPVFVFALFNNIKDKLIWSGWLSVFLVSVLIFSHGSTGFSQFGYRFAADFYPIIVFLVIKSLVKFDSVKIVHWLILVVSIIVNFWGVMSLNIIPKW